MSHTAGPWTLVEGKRLEDYQWFAVEGDGSHIAELTVETQTDWANARLIAAAPELLEALNGLLDNSWQPNERGALELTNSIPFATHRAATDAVAKATGEQP